MRGLCVSKLFPPSKKGTVSKITAPKQKQKISKKEMGKSQKVCTTYKYFWSDQTPRYIDSEARYYTIQKDLNLSKAIDSIQNSSGKPIHQAKNSSMWQSNENYDK